MRIHNKQITELGSKDIFVFGSNVSGFHGAGSAGYAFKGTTVNDWRTNDSCLKAIEAKKSIFPVGFGKEEEKRRLEREAALVGKWCIWGKAYGLQRGREGNSYGIVTTERAGQQGFVTLKHVKEQFASMCKLAFVIQDDGYVFWCVPFGLSREFGGYSWFTLQEMKDIVSQVDAEIGVPNNIILPEKFVLGKIDHAIEA